MISINSIKGNNFNTHRELDNLLIQLDGTDNKNVLGANAILGVSMAFVHAQSNKEKIPLYELINYLCKFHIELPAKKHPMINSH